MAGMNQRNSYDREVSLFSPLGFFFHSHCFSVLALALYVPKKDS